MGRTRMRVPMVWSSLLGLALCSPAGAAGCLSYDAPATLDGVIGFETFPGPPNYQSVESGDKPETALVMRLNSPICVDAAADGMSDAVQGVVTVQLALRGADQFALFRKQAGSRVRLTGTLFGAHTAHHRTPVLLGEITGPPSSQPAKP